MADTPMVIMWTNADGTVTLSQRTAPSEVEPTVESDPPRVASYSSALSVVSRLFFRIFPSQELILGLAFIFETFSWFHDSGRYLIVAEKCFNNLSFL